MRLACSQIYTITAKGDEADERRVPLLFVHGFAAGVGIWAASIDCIAERRVVHAIDLLGKLLAWKFLKDCWISLLSLWFSISSPSFRRNSESIYNNAHSANRINTLLSDFSHSRDRIKYLQESVKQNLQCFTFKTTPIILQSVRRIKEHFSVISRPPKRSFFFSCLEVGEPYCAVQFLEKIMSVLLFWMTYCVHI